MKNAFQRLLLVAILLLQGILVCAQERPELTISVMHDKDVTDAAYSPDGKLIATGSDDFTVKIWKASDGKLIRKLTKHTGSISCLAFNGDGTNLLTAANDSTAIVWDVISGKDLFQVNMQSHTPYVQSAYFSPDGQRILLSCANESKALEWKIGIDTILQTYEGHSSKSYEVGLVTAKYSSNDKFILTYDYDNVLRIWNSKTGGLLHELNPHNKKILFAGFSPDGTNFVTASEDKTLKIWDCEKGLEINKFSVSSSENKINLNYSDDSQKILISTGNKFIEVINLADKKINLFNVVNSGNIKYAIFSPRSKYILALSESGKIIQMNASTGKEIRVIEEKFKIHSLKFSPDGLQFIAFGSSSYYEQNGCSIYDSETGEQLINIGEKTYIQKPQYVVVSKSGKFMCVGLNGYSQIIDAKSGKVLFTLNDVGSWYSSYYSDFTPVFSANDSLLAITDRRGNSVKIWMVETGLVMYTLTGHTGSISSIRFANDSKTIITAADDNTAKVWQVKTGRLIQTIKHNDITSADISSDSEQVITTTYKNGSKIWNVGNGKLLNTLNEKDTYTGFSQFSPDGKYIVIGADSYQKYNSTKILTILDSKKFTIINTIKYLDVNPFNGIYFSHDGNKIIVKTREFYKNSKQTVLEYEIESGKLLFTHDVQNGKLMDVDWVNNRYYVNRDSKVVLCNLTDDSEILSRITTKNETLTIDPNGHFDGDQILFSKLYFVNKLETIPLDSYFEEFYTPNLWSRTLNGDTIEKTVINLTTQKPLPLVAFIRPPVGKIKFRGDSNASLKTDNIDYELEYSITDQGGGINEIRVFQNGKLIYSDIPKINQLDKSITHKLPIKLISGTNSILITAFNDDRIEKSETAIIDFTGKEIESSRLFMLCIGINEYQKSSYNLNFAEPDASSFLDAIYTGSKDLFSEIIIDSVKNKDATKKNILSAIKKIQNNCKPNDVFIFYYAGHGVMNEDFATKSSLYYIVPHEVTNFYNLEMLKQSGISANEITEFSKEIKAQKQIFILDACQSGGALDQIASRGAVEEKAIAVLARSTGTYFLVASNSEQLASEFAALGHGVFTYSLLLGLTGQADSDQDKKISIKELSIFVESKVPELSEQFKGNAQYPSSYGYGQDFPISLSDKYKMESKIAVPASKYSSYSLEELVKMKEAAITAEEYLKAEELKIEIGKRK